MLERRYLTTEFRVSPEGQPPVISGYGAVFDSPSLDLGWVEEIDPHAFDAVLASKPDTRGLFNHDEDHVLGRTTAGTLKLRADSRGLAYEIEPPDTQFARDLVVSMRRGDISGSSFGFICKRDQWTENPDGTVTRRILEIDQLIDVSIVTFPAYPAADSGVRSLPTSMPMEMRSRFEKRDYACQSDCAQCQSGACGICSAPDCSHPECRSCQQQAQRAHEQSDKHKMQMQLALLSL